MAEAAAQEYVVEVFVSWRKMCPSTLPIPFFSGNLFKIQQGLIASSPNLIHTLLRRDTLRLKMNT